MPCSIDETSALYLNFLDQVDALKLSELAQQIVLAHLHTACRAAERGDLAVPSFTCRDEEIYLRTTGGFYTEEEGIPPLVIAYMVIEDEPGDLLLETVFIDLLSRHEEGDADTLYPADMVRTLLDALTEDGELPESLVQAIERLLDELWNQTEH